MKTALHPQRAMPQDAVRTAAPRTPRAPRPHRRTLTWSGCAIAVLSLSFLAGCSALTGGVDPSAGPRSPQPTSAPSAPSSSSSASPSVDTPSSTDDFDIDGEGGCDPRQLELRIALPAGGGGAGSTSVILTYHNSSEVDCRLEGNPAVDLLAADTRAPLGATATPEYDYPGGSIPLPAGADAYSVVRIVSAGPLPCSSVLADSIAVTMPHREAETAVIMPLPTHLQACVDPSVQQTTSGTIIATFPGT